MDWKIQMMKSQTHELDNSQEHAEDKPLLNYVGEWSREPYVTESGISIPHSDMWHFYTKYKYMMKFANVIDRNGTCILDFGAEKLGRCLELGCDWGHCFDLFEQYFNEVFGIEITEWAAKHGQSLGYNIYQGMMEHNPFPENYFEAVFSNHVLEHSLHPRLTLSEVARVTVEGGWSIHTLPCRTDLAVEETTEDGIHQSNMTYEEWLAEFESFGFEIIRHFFLWNQNQEDWTVIARWRG